MAAHECGHAIQDDVDYAPLRFRSAFVPVANIGTQIAWPILLVGLLFARSYLLLPEAAIYMPLQELVDIEKEKERLHKEEKRLEGELNRVNGMLNNEKFVSRAPEAKIQEERAKLEKYTQMMSQVKERLAQLGE